MELTDSISFYEREEKWRDTALVVKIINSAVMGLSAFIFIYDPLCNLCLAKSVLEKNLEAESCGYNLLFQTSEVLQTSKINIDNQIVQPLTHGKIENITTEYTSEELQNWQIFAPDCLFSLIKPWRLKLVKFLCYEAYTLTLQT